MPWTYRHPERECMGLVSNNSAYAAVEGVLRTFRAPRRAVRQTDLDRVLHRIGPEAEAFWAADVADPRRLEPGIC